MEPTHLPVVDKLGESAPNPEADEGLSQMHMEAFLTEIRHQPDFRSEMDLCADFADGKQTVHLSLEERRGLEHDLGYNLLQRNLIGPTVRLVEGIAEQNRRDWRIDTDAEKLQPMAEALSAKLKEVQRNSKADIARSDAFRALVRSGLGWIGVGINSDALDYPYRCQFIHRREMAWDWFSRDGMLRDARYQVRRQWFNLTDLAARVPPDILNAIQASANGWPAWVTSNSYQSSTMASHYRTYRSASIDVQEWLNPTKSRVALTEVTYATHVRGLVVRWPDDTSEVFDESDPMHLQAINDASASVEPAIYRQLRTSLWAGPFKIGDRERASRLWPYIPFFGFREDLTGIPFGLVRDMISPQKEINLRHMKEDWLLRHRRIIADTDAIDSNENSWATVDQQVARADARILLDPRKPNSRFKIEHDLEYAGKQFQFRKDAEEGLQDVAGVYQAQLGKGGDHSGVAISQMITQGSTTLAPLFNNFSEADQLVGESLLDLICQRIGSKRVEVVVGEAGRKQKIIILNNPVQDPETGQVALENEVDRSKIKMALTDVPSSPAYRQSQMTQIGELLKSMPPQAQAIVAPYFFEATDLPDRYEMADELRRQMGIQSAEGENPEADALRQALEQAQQLLQQMQAAPDMIRAKADVELKEAQADKLRTETDMAKLATIREIMARMDDDGGDDGNDGGASVRGPAGESGGVSLSNSNAGAGGGAGGMENMNAG